MDKTVHKVEDEDNELLQIKTDRPQVIDRPITSNNVNEMGLTD
jgi:hypothetical protein